MANRLAKIGGWATSLVFCSVSMVVATDKDTIPVAPTIFLSGRYVIKTQMIMPNLEESLRYTNSTVTKCLNGMFSGDLFPILSHQSLRGCKLIYESNDKNTYHYSLSCPGTNQTRGYAKVVNEGSTVSGVVNIRMGGKNMTFSQRVIATRSDKTDEHCPEN